MTGSGEHSYHWVRHCTGLRSGLEPALRVLASAVFGMKTSLTNKGGSDQSDKTQGGGKSSF